MPNQNMDDILPLVENPSQYIGLEVNSIRKDPDTVDLHLALAFPDLYEIGSSHFGIQILYHILNQRPDIYAERVFAPDRDMAQQLGKANASLCSLETKTPLAQFDILGFSLLYELNFTNVLYMMDLARIPFLAAQRDLSHPLVIAGGPCTCNPEPMAEFFDAMVIGDGETVVLALSQVYTDWKKDGSRDKNALLTAWSKIQGVYVPSRFEAWWTSEGFQKTRAAGALGNIKRSIVPDLDAAPFPDAPIVACGKPVHDRLRLEISRGCTRGCRFCQAGMIYRPVRERSMANLAHLSKTSLANTGYEDMSLLSLSTGDYSCLVPLMENLLEQTYDQPTAVSLPSIRVETLTPRLMNLIKSVRKTGFTIAPEAGTQRLRDVINKTITDEDIFKTVTDALSLGWQGIKLYFMVGLPTETQQDLQGMVDLVKGLLKIKGTSKRPQNLTVSVAAFIPKPHTPFQWATQNSLPEAREKIQWLKEALKLSRVQFKWQNPETSILEGLWARGDRRLSRLLVCAYEKGCTFDGWSDRFRFDLWQKALDESGVDGGFFTTRQRDVDEPLPWDHVDIGVKKTFLKKEWEKALQGHTTADCRWGDCDACGVCDHKSILPKVQVPNEGAAFSVHDKPVSSEYKKIFMVYTKIGPARFFGHLELAHMITRAVRRAGIEVKYSEGFHPKPKLSFQDPLPLGIASFKENMMLTVSSATDPENMMNALNRRLPEGIKFITWHEMDGKGDAQSLTPKIANYTIVLKDGFFDQKDLEYFQSEKEMAMTRVNKKGNEKTFNLKDFVFSLAMLSPNSLSVTLRSCKDATLRPMDILRQVFHISEEQIKLADITKN